nr:pilus assembly protein MshP [uncultured Pseudomonas sp.]
MRLNPREQGFGLVAAMFLIIVVAAVIATMARLAVTQNATTSLAIQQARAYQVARAGLEYGIARVLADAACADFTLDGFAVLMSCTSSSTPVLEEEGKSSATTFYRVEATATLGSPASPDYAYRKLTAVVEKP